VGFPASRRRRRHRLFSSTPDKSSSPTARPEAAKRIERVLTTDPGMGVVRHVDAGYEEAIEFAEKNNVKIPMK
jgi:hypothetical protein